MLVPGPASGTAIKGRAKRIKQVRVHDSSVYSLTMLDRLSNLVAWTGDAPETRDSLRYEGDCADDVGTIAPGPGPGPIWHCPFRAVLPPDTAQADPGAQATPQQPCLQGLHVHLRHRRA
ncbi:hypothetical protein ACIBW9_41750 [Streptomyces sp. NPDC049541]|uniref:hypothetical protein n=1 Tax=Streptomyces sp. NPDC049541 TaxID=3365594 RepID=UPI00378D7A4C